MVGGRSLSWYCVHKKERFPQRKKTQAVGEYVPENQKHVYIFFLRKGFWQMRIHCLISTTASLNLKVRVSYSVILRSNNQNSRAD